MSNYLSAAEIRRALSIRDLTDSAQGPHAMQAILADISSALRSAWGLEPQIVREIPVVEVADNYDRLRYEHHAAARDRRYTRYLSETVMLRSHTSALIPRALEEIRGDAVLICPGLVYRRDVIDRLHVGEPHQVDLWRISYGKLMERSDLLEMIGHVVNAILPGCDWRALEVSHPYTVGGLEIVVKVGDAWVEIGECGLAHPEVLAGSGLSEASGLAMGIGLDRAVMLRKGIDDIRLLRADDPRIAKQMLDLKRYKPVSAQPPVRRDLSVAVDCYLSDEELGDRVRSALGDRVAWIEEIAVLSRTPAADLPPRAVERLGIKHQNQDNVLLRVILRHTDRTLTSDEANVLRDEIYESIHEGSVYDWCSKHRKE